MSEAQLRILLWILGILVSVIGFFLVLFINRTQQRQDEHTKSINETHRELSDSINKLNLSITGLNGIILSMQERDDLFNTGCRDKHFNIDRQMNEHEKRLNEHDMKLTEINTKVKYS